METAKPEQLAPGDATAPDRIELSRSTISFVTGIAVMSLAFLVTTTSTCAAEVRVHKARQGYLILAPPSHGIHVREWSTAAPVLKRPITFVNSEHGPAAASEFVGRERGLPPRSEQRWLAHPGTEDYSPWNRFHDVAARPGTTSPPPRDHNIRSRRQTNPRIPPRAPTERIDIPEAPIPSFLKLARLLNPDDNGITTDLTLKKTSVLIRHNQVRYDLRAGNRGSNDAVNVLVTDQFVEAPDHLSVITMSPSCTLNARERKLTCSVSKLAPRQAVNFFIFISADGGGTLRNMAEVTSDTLDSDPDNNTAALTLMIPDFADLSVHQSARVGSRHRLTLHVAVNNSGPDTALNINVVDRLALTSDQFRVISLTPGCTYDEIESSFRCVADSLGPRKTQLFHIVLQVDPRIRKFANLVTVMNEIFDPILENNTNSAFITKKEEISARDPPVVDDQIFSVEENAPDKTFVGRVEVGYRGPRDTLRFAVTGGDGAALFAIFSRTTKNTAVPHCFTS